MLLTEREEGPPGVRREERVVPAHGLRKVRPGVLGALI